MFTNKKPSDVQENLDKEWIPTWTPEGKNTKHLDSELWTYYKRLEKLLENNQFGDPKGI